MHDNLTQFQLKKNPKSVRNIKVKNLVEENTKSVRDINVTI